MLKLFKKRHIPLFLIGFIGSIINHGIILPVLLFIILDLDYSKLDKKNQLLMITFFGYTIFFILFFGGYNNAY